MQTREVLSTGDTLDTSRVRRRGAQSVLIILSRAIACLVLPNELLNEAYLRWLFLF